MSVPADPAIDALAEHDRAVVGQVWASRARQELGAGAVFASLSDRLSGVGAAQEVLALLERAPADESRHCDVCLEVAAHYLGHEVARPTEQPIGRPSLVGVRERDLATVHLVLNCCINETVGSAYLRACLDQVVGSTARAAIRELMRDEIDHARIGWAHLASSQVSDESRALVGEVAPALLEHCRASWLERAGQVPAELPRGHGCLPGSDFEAIVQSAYEDIVLPGFRHLGIAVP